MNDPEVKALVKLVHPNIVKLKEVIRQSNIMFIIFELLNEDLSVLMRQRYNRKQPFKEVEVANIIHQLAGSLEYMHDNGFFHRDLKPENILVDSAKKKVKISDFGLIKETNARGPYTEYVSTRWYRAPECVLRSTKYGPPVDIFALGCIMAELYLQRPIFPGKNELD